MAKRFFMLLLFGSLLLSFRTYAQSVNHKIYGKIVDSNDIPLELVNISVKGSPTIGTITNEAGRFELSIGTLKECVLIISSLGYVSQEYPVKIEGNRKITVNIVLIPSNITLPEIAVKSSYTINEEIEHISPKAVVLMPSLNNSIENLIKAVGLGVQSNNELSTQYSVRGGSYDENLIYLNGIEVYRPFLIRSGQQEGLSFINPDLVSEVNFSSGGFSPYYGDKMSSVLDVRYKTPLFFKGSVYGSLLGAGCHVENLSKNKKFSYLLGVRYLSNSYLIKKMQTQGDAKPNFTDVQLLLNYTPHSKWTISLFGNYSRNSYQLIPATKKTTFGHINDMKRLTVYFDGQEIDAYQTLFTALTTTYSLNKNNSFSLVFSHFNTIEKETFDIEGQYFLSEVNTDFGSEDLGESLSIRAVGGDLHHGRNFLNANIFHSELKGSHTLNNNLFIWGLKAQGELINDKLCEWRLRDSAFYTLPFVPFVPGDSVPFEHPARALIIDDYLTANNNLQTFRFSGYAQNKWTYEDSSYLFILTGGVRFSYWSFNHELIVTPRIRLTFQPKIKSDISFYLASGMYYQPPFYKEMRYGNGKLNTAIKSQKSYHLILGCDYLFKIARRPFKLTSEVYYKYLYDLITYSLDNVRVVYSGTNDARGYAVGIDAKLSGEIVPGAESWLSFSLMKTMEDLKGDYFYLYLDSNRNVTYNMSEAVSDSIVYPGFLPRLTDQRFSINLFFQDKVPRLPMLKAHINLIYSTPVMYYIPKYTRANHGFRSPKDYFRADIGLSWQFINDASISNPKNPLRVFKAAYLTFEIFNIFNYYNIISFTYIKDIDGNPYRVPNYLTPRLFNVKLRFEF